MKFEISHDTLAKQIFEKSFRINFPELCKDCNIVIIDAWWVSPVSLAWLPWKGGKAPRVIDARLANTKFARKDA